MTGSFSEKKTALVISPHPDDLEISCAGTLRKLQCQGYKIISVITVQPSAEDNPNRTELIVRQELANSYEHSKFELRVHDTDLWPNKRPNLVVNNITMTKLAKLLVPCDIAIIPNPQDYHQDHRATYDLAFPLVKKLANEIWLTNSYPYCHYYKNNTANLFVDITEHWDFKQKLLECYNSYLSAKDIEEIKASNGYWGYRRGTQLAEAFSIVQKNV